MSNATSDANKALVLAHYDAVINRLDPDAIRAQLASDFFDHAAGKRMSAEEVIAYATGMHEASPIFRRWPNVWWPSATSSPAVSSGGAGTAAPGAALPRPVAMSNSAA